MGRPTSWIRRALQGDAEQRGMQLLAASLAAE